MQTSFAALDEFTVTVPGQLAEVVGLTGDASTSIDISFDTWLVRSRELMTDYLPPRDILASEEFILDRRAEAARDEWETARDRAEDGFWRL